MPTEVERLMQEIIQDAPSLINQAESAKNYPKIADSFKKLDAMRPTPTTANPDWEAAINKLTDDDLYKLTYSFMRHKKNTTMDNALLRGSALSSCKILYESYVKRCTQHTPPTFDIQAEDPIISEKFQALHKLMYDTHIDLRTNDPQKAVAVEVSFALYGKATPSVGLADTIAKQLLHHIEVNLPLSTPEAPPAGGEPPESAFFQSVAKRNPPPLPRMFVAKMEAEEEIQAIVFQERLTALKSELVKYKKNNVAEDLHTQCSILDESFKNLTDCYKKGDFQALKEHPLLNAVSIHLKDLSPIEKEKADLTTLSFGTSILSKQLDSRIGEAIENEAKKSGKLLSFLSKPNAEFLHLLTSDASRTAANSNLLHDPRSIGKMWRPTLK